MLNKMLSDSESDGDTLQQLTINEHFAKAFARKKEREELTKRALFAQSKPASPTKLTEFFSDFAI